MTNVSEYLADPYYGIEKRKYEIGSLKITIAEPNWKPEWYSDPYRNISMPLALQIAKECRSSNNFKVFYDPNEDFHHITFDYDGDAYDIQWYKVYSMRRLSDNKTVLFGRIGNHYQVSDFLRSAGHKTERWY